MPSIVRLFKISDAGPKNNEDSCYVNQIDNRILACVADGVGGLAKGEIASGFITRCVENWFNEEGDSLPHKGVNGAKEALEALVRKINDDLLGIKAKYSYNFGSTVDIALIGDKKLLVVHIGDSRVYLFNGRQVKQITADQTLDEFEKVTGETVSGYENARKEHMLTQCMGSSQINPYLYDIDIPESMDILMCSDGLSNTLTEHDIQRELRKTQTGGEALASLVKKARENGETDNITAVLIRRRTRKSKEVN